MKLMEKVLKNFGVAYHKYEDNIILILSLKVIEKLIKYNSFLNKKEFSSVLISLKNFSLM